MSGFMLSPANFKLQALKKKLVWGNLWSSWQESPKTEDRS